MVDILAPGWVMTNEAQELTGYAIGHLQRLARGGRVNARKLGDSWVFERDSLLTYQAVTRSGPKPKPKPGTSPGT